MRICKYFHIAAEDVCRTRNDCPSEAKCISLFPKQKNGYWVTCKCPPGFKFDDVDRQCHGMILLMRISTQMLATKLQSLYGTDDHVSFHTFTHGRYFKDLFLSTAQSRVV